MLDVSDFVGRRVAVALSGGVDSGLTASLLKEQGADVVALTMLLQKTDTGKDAARVAQAIGVPHFVIDLSERFKSCVMDEFADSYLRGQTPNPCVYCNRRIKFGDLMMTAREMGAESFATGHYARRVVGKDGVELHQAKDPLRDQSYFLFALAQAQIDFLRFPLGDITKKEVRVMAAQRGLPCAEKKDSQDICFVPDGDYVSVVERLRPGANKAGNIVDQTGRVLGSHKGIIHFTVGQRKGLDLNSRTGDNNEPLYVLRLDASRGEVVVGAREALACREVFLHNMNWLAGDVLGEGQLVTVRLRSSQAPVPARFFMEEEGRGRIVLDEPTYGVAIGQAGVIYDETRVLGGGLIV